MEEELLDAQCGCLQGIVDSPERCAGGVAYAGSTLAGNAVGLAADCYEHLTCVKNEQRTQARMRDHGGESPRCLR